MEKFSRVAVDYLIHIMWVRGVRVLCGESLLRYVQKYESYEIPQFCLQQWARKIFGWI